MVTTYIIENGFPVGGVHVAQFINHRSSGGWFLDAAQITWSLRQARSAVQTTTLLAENIVHDDAALSEFCSNIAQDIFQMFKLSLQRGRVSEPLGLTGRLRDRCRLPRGCARIEVWHIVARGDNIALDALIARRRSIALEPGISCQQ